MAENRKQYWQKSTWKYLILLNTHLHSDSSNKHAIRPQILEVIMITLNLIQKSDNRYQLKNISDNESRANVEEAQKREQKPHAPSPRIE